MATTYYTVYSKKDGTPHFTYAASVQEWLATGEYTLEAPKEAKPAPELAQSKLPTAGREANRENPIFSGMNNTLSKESEVHVAESSPAEVPPTAAPESSADASAAEAAPVRPAPRRRSHVSSTEG